MVSFEEITSYVDNELKDELIINRITLLIKEDYVTKTEYLRQSYIKELLKNKFCKTKAPEHLIKQIIEKINGHINSSFQITRKF